MKTINCLIKQSPIITTLGLICVVVFTGAFQDPVPTPKPNIAQASNADRIEQLEQRVTILEKILFSSPKLGTKRAERLLADRRATLKNSRELFAKGLISEFEVQQDERLVAEAERELELATTESRHHQLASELELLNAEREFKFATEQLEYQRRLLARGFATTDEVKRLENIVDIAERNLKQAKIKLEGARELDALKK